MTRQPTPKGPSNGAGPSQDTVHAQVPQDAVDGQLLPNEDDAGNLAEMRGANPQDRRGDNHTLDDSQRLLMSLDQQCKDHAIAARQEQHSMLDDGQSGQDPFSPHALQDYHVQVMLVEQQKQDRMQQNEQRAMRQNRRQSKRRLMAARHMQDGPREGGEYGSEQAADRHRQAYDMHLMLLEEQNMMLVDQQNKRRLIAARQMQDNPRADGQSGHEQVPNHARQDYEMQLMLLEQQNKKRLIMARQDQQRLEQEEQQARLRDDGQSGHEQVPNHARQDYEMQLMLLEQQNKKRLIMARQEQQREQEEQQARLRGDGQSGHEPLSGQRLQDYQMQLMLLEQQNKKRLMMARQEQDRLAAEAQRGPELPPSAPATSSQGRPAGHLSSRL